MHVSTAFRGAVGVMLAARGAQVGTGFQLGAAIAMPKEDDEKALSDYGWFLAMLAGCRTRSAGNERNPWGFVMICTVTCGSGARTGAP